MYLDDLPSIDIDADGYCCRFMRSSVLEVGDGFWYCGQITWKKKSIIWHADVTRWLTLVRHQSRWVLLTFYASIRTSNRLWDWVEVLRTNCLEEMHADISRSLSLSSSTLMGIIISQFVHPAILSWVWGWARDGCCYHWGIGGICYHYWQYILVNRGNVISLLTPWVNRINNGLQKYTKPWPEPVYYRVIA